MHVERELDVEQAKRRKWQLRKDLMRQKLIAVEATPEKVAEHLMPFETGVRGTVRWSEALRLGRHKNCVGEVRSADDWNCVPRDTELRVVSFMDQGVAVIRWGNPACMGEVLSGPYHDHMICYGDNLDLSTVKSGYVKVKRDGTLEVL
jgi:hypothetical protein